MYLILFFGEASTFKKVGPTYTWAVLLQPVCAHGKEKKCMCAHVTVHTTDRVYLLFSVKN
jgi:hypothetical protein